MVLAIGDSNIKEDARKIVGARPGTCIFNIIVSGHVFSYQSYLMLAIIGELQGTGESCHPSTECRSALTAVP